ncbi:MAG: hypothetical protein AAGE61_20360 [Pseudomonadota bacterium]
MMARAGAVSNERALIGQLEKAGIGSPFSYLTVRPVFIALRFSLKRLTLFGPQRADAARLFIAAISESGPV